MPDRVVPIHYLRDNMRDWTPAHVAFFDTESRITADDKGETHRLRCWAARAIDRRPLKNQLPRDAEYHGTTSASLASWVGDIAKGRSAVWVFAHNLTYDLTSSSLLRLLVKDGWQVGHATMGGKSCWVRLTRRSSTVTFVDSWTWLPTDLGEVGNAVGILKPVLPTQDADAAEWLARCKADVDILAAGMCQLMAWFDRHKLGNWAPTGAATGWNTYRHRESTTAVTIHPEPEVIAEDRRYVNGGRRAVWQLGRQTAGPYVELDIAGAYPTIAASFPLPRQHRAPFESMPLDAWQIDSDRWSPVARCRIRTSAPSVAVKWSGATFYPVGEFWADLTGPEIREARDLGTLVEIGPGRIHQMGYSMRGWAQWVLETVNGDTPQTPPVAQIAAKHWSRSTIGKWASHAFVTTELGRSPNFGWGYEDAWDHNRNCRASVQDIAGKRFVVSAGGDPENAYPVVFAWVEAHVRVALNRVIECIGEGALLTANTDGMIAASRIVGTAASGGSVIAPEGLKGAARLDWVIARCNERIDPLRLRIKGSVGHVTVLGPQHVQIGRRRAFSGIPAGAVEIEANRYEFQTWPGMTRQLQSGMRDGYRRDIRRVRIAGPYPSGWVLESGRVRPVEMTIDAAGNNQVVPFYQSRWAALAERAAPEQRRELARLA